MVELLDTPGLNRFDNDDPHVWLDPTRYELIAHRIGDELGTASVQPFVARLKALDRDYRGGLAHCVRDDIVTSHDAFGYLAQRYGLNQIPITGLSPEAEPSPKDLTGSSTSSAARRRRRSSPRLSSPRGSQRRSRPRPARAQLCSTRSRASRLPRPRRARITSRRCDRTSPRCARRSDAASRRLRHVCFAYPGGPEVLHDVDLEVEAGEFVAIAGPNGGGKTTLLRVAVGLEQPARGEALPLRRTGRPVRTTRKDWLPAQRAQLGIDAPVTVREVVESGLVSRRLLGRGDRSLVDEAIERVGLSNQSRSVRAGSRADNSSVRSWPRPLQRIRTCSSSTSRPPVST